MNKHRNKLPETDPDPLAISGSDFETMTALFRFWARFICDDQFKRFKVKYMIFFCACTLFLLPLLGRFDELYIKKIGFEYFGNERPPCDSSFKLASVLCFLRTLFWLKRKAMMLFS